MEKPATTDHRGALLAASMPFLVLAVGWVDYATGEELSVSVLYLVPVCVTTWWAGRRWGLAMAVASAAASTVADTAASQRLGHPLIPYWNAGMLLGFFGLVVYLLSALKASHAGLEDEVEHRTSALRREIG